MAYNFLRDNRDQPFLLPPDLRDWLPKGHLAWFVLDVVQHYRKNSNLQNRCEQWPCSGGFDSRPPPLTV
jgi:hypothetical protein